MNKTIIALLLAPLLGMVSLTASAGGNIANGEALAKKYACASCHGADFNKAIDPTYPKLAGQHADYLQHALQAYKRGGAKPYGRNNAIMVGMVRAAVGPRHGRSGRVSAQPADDAGGASVTSARRRVRSFECATLNAGPFDRPVSG